MHTGAGSMSFVNFFSRYFRVLSVFVLLVTTLPILLDIFLDIVRYLSINILRHIFCGTWQKSTMSRKYTDHTYWYSIGKIILRLRLKSTLECSFNNCSLWFKLYRPPSHTCSFNLYSYMILYRKTFKPIDAKERLLHRFTTSRKNNENT